MIIDAVAAIVMVLGALLILLGAVGLVRFPDVFSRMHSATKSATVGVIGVTAAAALEAGALSGALTLFLVIALLFLSGPLGMSLLARAAYHDPDTPRSPRTREIRAELPKGESTSAKRTGGTSRFLALWLWVVWIALFGSTSPGVLIGGGAASLGVAYLMRLLAPRWPEALLHPVAAVRFVFHFFGQLAIATWDTTLALFRSPDSITPAVVAVPLRAHTRHEVTLLMNAISFTPGTVALELHDNVLYVHVLDTDDPTEEVAEIVTMEDRIMAAFGSSSAEGNSANDPRIT